MRKKIIPKIATVAVMLASVTPVSAVFAEENPVYVSNKVEDLMVVKINPTENYFVIEYNESSRLGERPTYVNFQFGGLSDYQLHNLADADITKTIYKGSTDKIREGAVFDSYFIHRFQSEELFSGVNLADNTSGMIDFYVSYGDGEAQRSRVDYRRCVNSSVFDSETMECVVEEIGNGYVRYRPQTIWGDYVEIPLEEDLALRKMTNEWRAEPGDWGQEWNPDGVDDTSGAGSAQGGDETDGEQGKDSQDDKRDEDEGQGGENEQNQNFEQGEQGEGEQSQDQETASDSEGDRLPGQTEDNDSNALVVARTTEENANTATNTDTVGAYPVDSSDADSISEISTESTESNEESTVNVPGLGQESDSQPNWTAIIAISAASVAGLVGWFFIILGKHKLKKRKENEE